MWFVENYHYSSCNLIDSAIEYLRDNPTTRLFIYGIEKNYTYLSMKYSSKTIVESFTLKNIEKCLTDPTCRHHALKVKRTIKNTSNKRTYLMFNDDEVYVIRRIIGANYIETLDNFGKTEFSAPIRMNFSNGFIIPYSPVFILDKIPMKNRIENLIAYGKKLPDTVKVVVSTQTLQELNLKINNVEVSNSQNITIEYNGHVYELKLIRVMKNAKIYYPFLILRNLLKN